MDPVSQGALGAIASENIARRKHLAIAAILGAMAGMAPDLDMLISSDEDPLLFLEYHRQFTHSLIFIPVGGLLCALLLHQVSKRWELTFWETFKYCCAGYATHALLDSCTSYGTQLFWPFSDYRVSWSTISIVDPLFTVPILTLVVFAALRKQRGFARAAAAWVFIYLGLGLIQKERAETAGMELAQSRGHDPVRLEAKPGFGNILLWKVVYEAGDRYHVDAIRAGLETKVYAGTSVAKLDVKRDFPWLDPASQQARDIERFRWFSDGMVSVDPEVPNRIIDVRYSMLPNEIHALWLIELDRNAGPEDHVGYIHLHGSSEGAVDKLKAMLLGLDLN